MLLIDSVDKEMRDIFDIVSGATYDDANANVSVNINASVNVNANVNANSKAKVYLVGGAVRDIILNSSRPLGRKIRINDLDFVVFGVDYVKFAHTVAKKLKSVAIPFKDNMRIPLYGKACKVSDCYMQPNMHIDMSAPRGADIYEDILNRDFTINNLALDLHIYNDQDKAEYYSIVGDRADLDNMVIRPVNNDVFDVDPVRILRGFRQSISLGFKLSDQFLNVVKGKVELLSDIAYERVQEELKKMAFSTYDDDDKVKYLKYIEEYGIWRKLFQIDVDSGSIVAVSDKELLVREVDSYCQGAEKQIGGSDPIYTAEDIYFSIFLSALFSKANGDCLDEKLKKLLVSNKVRKLTTELVTVAKEIHRLEGTPKDGALSSQDKAMKLVVWRSYKIIPFILFVAERIYGVDNLTSSAYKKLLHRMDIPNSEVISGEDIVEIAVIAAPRLKGGVWISELLEEVKVKLAFLELRSKDEAISFIADNLKSYDRGTK